MKKWVFENGHYQLKEIDVPVLHDNEVEITVKAAGLNYADIKILRAQIAGHSLERGTRKAQEAGSEVSGVVSRTGRDAFRFGIGERVFAVNHWGGAFAEKMIVPEYAIQRIPIGMSFTEAAGFGVAAQTAYNLLHIQGVKELHHQNAVCLVHAAAGATGTAVVQMAKHFGFRVLALVGKAEKKAWFLEKLKLEPPEWCVVSGRAQKEDEIHQCAGDRGVSLVFDGNGGSEFSQNFRYLRLFGKVVLYGNSAGDIPPFNPYELVFHSHQILGFSMRAATADPPWFESVYQSLFELYRKGNYQPIMGKTFAFQELPAALKYIESGESCGKITLSTELKSS
ncbi:MAG: zinc-binding dehydrogenase [Chloroherpetonaceae bacterium]|nr:zinc-binding dehydrogenase [Chloroherpetonaceae bacterium]